eukprot:2018248-Prymnesium_polylepis.1
MRLHRVQLYLGARRLQIDLARAHQDSRGTSPCEGGVLQSHATRTLMLSSMRLRLQRKRVGGAGTMSSTTMDAHVARWTEKLRVSPRVGRAL